MYPDPKRADFRGKTLTYLERDLSRYISRPGVFPLLIPDLVPEELVGFLDNLDGLVLAGGADVAPETYDEKPIGKWKGDAYRDQYELSILDYMLERGKPVFGICRGMQLMNVYFGGSLYQDIDTQMRESSGKHRNEPLYDQHNHEIELVEGTMLARLHEDDPNRRINTLHHQAIKELGEDLTVWARSPEDGMIEAFGWDEAAEGKVFGVQWHPEFFIHSKKPLLDPDRVYVRWLAHCAGMGGMIRGSI